MKFGRVAAGLALAAWLAASDASAAIITATYTGEVGLSFDQAGVFGAPQSSLRGSPFSAVFTYDDAVAGAGHFADSHSEEIAGGGGSLFSSPLLDATLTINGHTVSFLGLPGMTNGRLLVDNLLEPPPPFGGWSVASGAAGTLPNGGTTHLGVQIVTDDAPTHFVPYVGEGSLFGVNTGTAYWIDVVDGVGVARFSVDLMATNVRLDVGSGAAPVPEPASWAVMVLGFGGLGAMLRRRRVGLLRRDVDLRAA